MSNHARVYNRLAELDKDTVVNEAALAELLEVNPRTVRRMEENHHLPNHFKLGAHSCWIIGMVIEFFYQRAAAAQGSDQSGELVGRYTP